MKKAIFISVVNGDAIYKKCILENKYINGREEVGIVCLDNTIENKNISIRYNEFISGYDFSNEAWFVFCHSDWEIREDIIPRLNELDKKRLYGPIGVIITENDNGIITREYKGRIFDKKRDGSNERLMECDLFEDGALVDTFDCQCLIVHSSLIKEHDLKFDENLEFDFYVEDFCISAKINNNTESCILNVDCCHWQQLADIKERPHFFDKIVYINGKYRDYLFGAVIVPIGGNSGIAIKKIIDIPPIITKIINRSVVYHSDIDIFEIYDARVIAMNYIEKNTKILDVGCACGDFGKALKKVKKCTIYGMEYDVQSIKIAQETGSYVDVYQVDLNDFDWSRYSSLEKQFDYIVFGDVLEHILYPQETLNIFKYFLKDTGFFIVSLPNIAHASVKASLLNDEFGYTDTGLLDKTHVKFFTYKSVPKLLGDIGLELKEVMVTPLSIFGSLTNDPYLNMPLEIKDCIFSDPHSFVCQYVMKIAKSSFGKSRTNLNNKKKMEIENDQFPSDIWNLMEGTGIREIKTGLKLRAQELEFREQEFKLMNQEIILMRSSKFWRLRDWYLKFKFLFFSPLKFFKKYFNKLNSGKYHE